MERLEAGLVPLLEWAMCRCDREIRGRYAAELAAVLEDPIPEGIRGKCTKLPSPFRRLDLTPDDILVLGRRFIAQCRDQGEPLLLLGLRTSGSYFAPLLLALLRSEGFQTVVQLTIQPDKGPGRRELQVLRSCARAGFTAVLLDDSPHTGRTLLAGLEAARRAGFAADKLRVLLPVHPANKKGLGPLNSCFAIRLESQEWQKHRLLESEAVAERIAEYYRARGYESIQVARTAQTDEINATLETRYAGYRSSRLKRAYAVKLRIEGGETEYRSALVKSVGCGWLAYHAALSAAKLAGHLPPVLGLRDGMLYLEWVQQPAFTTERDDARAKLLDAATRYVADRVCRLSLRPTPNGRRRRLAGHENGLRLLAECLSRVYGPSVICSLARPGLEQILASLSCQFPTAIDGRMERQKWISGPRGFLKVDFEHHGMGKNEVNVVDPAYDLACTILSLDLSEQEEAELIRLYVEKTGDEGVEQRLYTSKLLAGFWAMQSARGYLLGKAQTAEVQALYHQQFLRAWNFLTVQGARYCGRQCRGSLTTEWAQRLVVLDVDGVIDRRIFGFPCTTAAGIEALSLLRQHGFSVALNTARSASEVREYCQAYALAGGVAELGAYLWDAITQRERILLDREEIRQLEALRTYLRSLPGVFLDPRYRYSVRAFTYAEKPKGLRGALEQALLPGCSGIFGSSPLSTLAVHHCMAELGLERLSFHHTSIDTTITAAKHDKGTGLAALRDFVLTPKAEIIAVGDSDTDLPMFRDATHSFAPGHIHCKREARLLGCSIVRQSYQRGLLEIARMLVHPEESRCDRCDAAAWRSGCSDLFLSLLKAADRPGSVHLARELLTTRAFRVLMR